MNTTAMLKHAPGWTVFDNLYLLNGTLYVVTREPDSMPPRDLITSSGYDILNGELDQAKRKPTDKDMRYVTPKQAAAIFGTSEPSLIDGTTFLINDSKQFLTHYYHFTAEWLFGAWRMYASLAGDSITSDGKTALPPPRRFTFVHSPEWRDYAHMNEFVIRSAFPGTAIELEKDWQGRAALGHLFVFERALLSDRAAAMKSEEYLRTGRSASVSFTEAQAGMYWWTTVRNNVVEFAGLDANAPPEGTPPVITYIQRQDWGRRMLRQSDHEQLVAELRKLEKTYGYEVNIVAMDKLTRAEQVRLSGRTTIMMGVHGNGLTSLVWMRPNPKATVMEFFVKDGFAFDYEWTTRALGMAHYGFWNNTYFTHPKIPPVNYPEGFQCNDIRLDGAAVAKLCHERLTLADSDD